eukprot:7351430-Pyramimonas_sp.AAC.2
MVPEGFEVSSKVEYGIFSNMYGTAVTRCLDQTVFHMRAGELEMRRDTCTPFRLILSMELLQSCLTICGKLLMVFLPKGEQEGGGTGNVIRDAACTRPLSMSNTDANIFSD